MIRIIVGIDMIQMENCNRNKASSVASHGSEASLSLGEFDEDEPCLDEIESTQKKEPHSGASSPILSGSITPPHVDFEEHEISDNEPNGSGNASPSGHEHIAYDSSPSG
eukprot:444186_1